jgi:multidrug efflux pump subunit AcrA (membrane-fusion protein)
VSSKDRRKSKSARAFLASCRNSSTRKAIRFARARPCSEIDRAPYEVALAQAKAQLSQAAARADQTKREETRLQPLVGERAVSRKEYDDALSARQLAEAALQQAKAGVQQADLNLSYTRVNAPWPVSADAPRIRSAR